MPVARFRSIGAQLVFRFTLATAFLLSVTFGVLYLLVVWHSLEEDKALLVDRLASLSEQLREPGGPATVTASIRTKRRSGEAAFNVRLLREKGAIVAETPRMTIPASYFPTATGGAGAGAQPRDYREEGRLFSLAAQTVNNGGENFIIQVAQDRSEDEHFRRQFGVLVLVVLLVAIVAAAGIALPVARQSLQPLHKLTSAVERTDEAHLSERVTAESWPRELQPLGAAFDRMLTRLDDSFRRLSQFSADLAHELRTPIANMMGEAQVALTRARPAEEYRAVIESTIAECERLTSIVETLLFLARAEIGVQRMQPRLFDARAALEKIASYFQPVADERGVTLTIDGEGQVLADVVLFERAVSNLIENSLQHTPAGGVISLQLNTGGDRAPTVTISDNGSGIPPGDLARVFDRFYRADPSRSVQGSGLGLALVKSIAELHGGAATVTSEMGRGTSVTLVLAGKAENAAAK